MGVVILIEICMKYPSSPLKQGRLMYYVVVMHSRFKFIGFGAPRAPLYSGA